MRRATGADGGDGDDYAARHEQCGPRQPPLRRDVAATHRQRQYIQRRYQNGIRSKKQGIWPRTAAGPILFVAAHESLVRTFETCEPALKLSVHRVPEVIGALSK